MLANLTTQSVNCIVDTELCLYMLGWAKSCSILDDRGRNQTDETSIQGTVMKGATDWCASAIGCEVWMKLGSATSCELLTGRHKPARGSGGGKSGRTVRAGVQNASHSMPQKFLAIFCGTDS